MTNADNKDLLGQKILISKPYLEEILQLIKQNPMEGRYDYMKLIKYLHKHCFIYCTKVGIRTPIFKATG